MKRKDNYVETSNGIKPRKNPLFYLGWLGLIGVLGILYQSLWMLTCLLFFFFFSYGKMVPDELFWNNVRKAGAKAFAVNMGLDVIGFLLMYVRAMMWQDRITAPEITGDMAQISVYYLAQIGLGQVLLVWIFVITMCTFFFTLMYYRRREKKFTEEEVC